MEENREVKSAREIAIVVAICIVCFIAGIAIHKLVLAQKQEKAESNNNNVVTFPNAERKIDYSKFYSNQELNDFYNDFGYEDIRTLGKDYSVDRATNENCYVHTNSGTFNEEILLAFEANVESGVPSAIRVIETTIEGDIIITDIKYDGEKVKVVRDFTRDLYMNEEDATITYLEYEGIQEYEYNGRRLLVIHNGELTNESFENNTTNITIYLG